MAKNSQKGNRERAARRRAALAARGIRPVQVLAPEAAHFLIRQAAGLMTRDGDPLEPHAALRQAGGTNEREPEGGLPNLVAELDAAKARIAEIESQAEALRVEIEAGERQRQALETERDAARAAEAAEREKAQAGANEAQKAIKRATEALQQAKRADAAIHRVKTLPGIRGRLVRWLVGPRAVQR